MQDQNKQDFSRTRRANPIRIVEGPGLANADALRDVHMSLVRAEQNLFNLVQASQANGHAGHAAFGFPGTATQLAPAYAAAGFAPGFAPAVNLPPQTALPYGVAHAPWAASQPSISAWSPLANGLTGAGPGSTFGPGVFGAGPIGAGPVAAMFARTPACDVVDEGKQFVCLLDLPGVRAEQVELLASEHAIIITAYPESEADVASLVQAERTTAALQRAITLPTEIQPTGVKATLNNGVLSVSLPKVHPTAGPRRVKVQG
jgi:HSP20 family protein